MNALWRACSAGGGAIAATVSALIKLPLRACACLCILTKLYAEVPVLTDRQQIDRRNAILRILRGGVVRRQNDLAQLLKKEGFEVTQSSISRDLHELGVLKAGGRYLVPPDEISRANGDFGALSQFVRTVRAAGNSITVIRTTIGAAASVAVALDKAEWPEVVGTISGDDTIFLATADSRAQQRLIERLNSLFSI
jgi:transcriptional regulator of arginine metabolism